MHAIGDAGVRTAVDAIEAARAADGNSSTHDALAHVQAVETSIGRTFCPIRLWRRMQNWRREPKR